MNRTITTTPTPTVADCRPGPDFRCVRWHGVLYSLTGNQAAIVRVLWDAWLAGTPDVGQETLLDAADSASGRLVDVFKGHAAWMTLVVHRLSYREEQSPCP